MSRSVPAAHLAQVRVHEVWVEGEAGVLLLHDGEEVLEGGDVEPGVQHKGHQQQIFPFSINNYKYGRLQYYCSAADCLKFESLYIF